MERTAVLGWDGREFVVTWQTAFGDVTLTSWVGFDTLGEAMSFADCVEHDA